MEATEKLCPDCGNPLIKDNLGIWKCPAGHGEWLRNEAEAAETPEHASPEVLFQSLTDGLPPLRWRTAAKPILQNGPIALRGKNNSSRKNRKKYKPIKGFQPWQLV